MKRLLIIITFIVSSISVWAGIGKSVEKNGRVFHIAIANNLYGTWDIQHFTDSFPEAIVPRSFIRDGHFRLPNLRGTINDAINLNQKLKYDYAGVDGFNVSETVDKRIDTLVKDSMFTHMLLNENANYQNIKNAFKEVLDAATPDDVFIFSFSGIGFQINIDETVLLTYVDQVKDASAFRNASLTVSQLCAWLRQLPCRRQLIISDACHGNSLALPVMNNLFNTERIINEERNIGIISAEDIAYERYINTNHFGELTYSLIMSPGNIYQLVKANEYEQLLAQMKVVEAKLKNRSRAKLFTESDFRLYTDLLKRSQPNLYRGGVANATQKEKPKSQPKGDKLYAIMIATNEYKKGSGWRNLKNPSRDADAVSEQLSSRYGANIIPIRNPKNKIQVLDVIDSVKNLLGEDDQLILFIAGHGGYHEADMDGYCVLSESEPLEQDKHLQSYLTFGEIRNKLGLSKARNVMVILDVCFGGNFDVESKEVSMATYRNADLEVNELIDRENKTRSRIFLAAGEYEVPDYWSNSRNHSPFADKLIELLKTEKEFTCPGRIYEHLKGNVTKPILKPFYGHKANGDFLLAVRNP